MFTEADLVYSFTRQDAFDEGMLVDASAIAAEAGFRVPLALTDTVWAECVAWPEGTKGAGVRARKAGCGMWSTWPGRPRGGRGRAGEPVWSSRCTACLREGGERPRSNWC